jgi:two-component system sensor histidine kinase/response regulator
MESDNQSGKPDLKSESPNLFLGFTFKQILIFFVILFIIQFVLSAFLNLNILNKFSLANVMIFVESAFIPIVLYICTREIRMVSSVDFKPWILLLIATTFNFLGDCVALLSTIYYQSTLLSFLYSGGILYLFFYPFFIWGLLSFSKEPITKSAKGKLSLDLLIIGFTVFLLFISFINSIYQFYRKIYPDVHLTEFGIIEIFIYPFLVLASLITVFYLILRAKTKIPKGVAALLEIGFFVYLISDIVFYYGFPKASDNLRNFADNGYILAEMMILLAGVYQILVLRSPAAENKRTVWVKIYDYSNIILKYSTPFWIILIAGLLWWLHYHIEYPIYDFLSAGLISLLILSTVRQYITSRENNLFTLKLKEIIDNRTEYLTRTLKEKSIEEKERKKLINELKESEEKYKALFENSPEAIFIFDYETLKIFDCNRAFRKLYGYTTEEIKNLYVTDITDDPELTKSNIRNSKNMSVVKFPSRYHKKKDGTLFPVELTHTSMILNGKQVASTIATDISEKRESEKKQKEYTEELERLNTAKDKFFSVVAHDLINPFQGLLGYIEILNSEENLTEEEKKQYISNLQTLSGNLYSLVKNLLHWSRLQSGTLKIEKSEINLREIAEEVIKPLAINSLRKNIDIINQIPDGLTVFADEMSVRLILSNLITNAIKFTDNNGEITVYTKLKPEGVFLCVKDTGVGISLEQKQLLFNGGSLLSAPGTHNEQGTGLGLVLCKRLIELHNGSIKIDSLPHVGTTVELFIPNNILQ